MAKNLFAWGGRKCTAGAVHTFMQDICVIISHKPCGHGSMSETVCLPFIFASVLEENKTPGGGKQGMHMKAWLKKRGHFSHDNLLGELEVSLMPDYKVYFWMFSFIFMNYSKRRHNHYTLLCNTSNPTKYCQHVCRTNSVVYIVCVWTTSLEHQP